MYALTEEQFHWLSSYPSPASPSIQAKGLFGRVLIVGGDEGPSNASVMAGTAALRTGAGLVQIAVPRTILTAALSITPELIGIGLGKGVGKDELLEAAQKADAIVIGPGMGQSVEAEGRLTRLVRLDKAMAVDADGLNLLAKGKTWPAFFRATGVLTPHPGEMAHLAKLFGRTEVPKDQQGRIDVAMQAAQTFKQTIVLKGQGTVVTDGARVYINATGDSSLSKAGTGDVLSGIIGTLLRRKCPRSTPRAPPSGYGRAGEIAGRRLGRRCVLADRRDRRLAVGHRRIRKSEE